MMSDKPHSADYFGDTRDFWWNRDFLELMSRRWNLPAVSSVLDVGCGVGHWGRCLAPFLPAGAQVTGVDREPRWVEEARARAAALRDGRFSYQQGEAERLPFPDQSFDMATCQTVLIHVKDPLVVLREMLRVLKPGGLLAVVEPNNVTVNLSNLDLNKPIADLVGLVEFQMICERGKLILGEGFNSLGTLVPGWFSQLGVERIEVHLSDKTNTLLPPYASAQEQAILREASEWSERRFWIWERADTLRYFLAGGGVPEDFDTHWTRAMASGDEFVRATEQGTLNLGSGPLCFLVSGRKPMK
jgi:ubiquinone/menaquinone biosynthesis C-methylase UbiE